MSHTQPHIPYVKQDFKGNSVVYLFFRQGLATYPRLVSNSLSILLLQSPE
jgi:hypothetical protein